MAPEPIWRIFPWNNFWRFWCPRRYFRPEYLFWWFFFKGRFFWALRFLTENFEGSRISEKFEEKCCFIGVSLWVIALRVSWEIMLPKKAPIVGMEAWVFRRIFLSKFSVFSIFSIFGFFDKFSNKFWISKFLRFFWFLIKFFKISKIISICSS